MPAVIEVLTRWEFLVDETRQGTRECRPLIFHSQKFLRDDRHHYRGGRGRACCSSVTIKRRYSKAGVKCGPLKDAGLQGILCYPDDDKQHPGVLVIGGSEGGIGLPDVSVLLASHGFAAVSLSYFGESGQPATLQNIPLNTSSERLIRCSHFPRCARDVSRCLEYLAVRKQHSNLPRCLSSSTLS